MFQGHLCSCTWTLWFCLETGHTQSFGKMQVWTPKPNVNTVESSVRYHVLFHKMTLWHTKMALTVFEISVGLVSFVSFRMSCLVEELARLQCYMRAEFLKR